MNKFLKSVAAVAAAGILLCSCGAAESNKAASELLSAVTDSGAAFEEMVSVEGADIKYTYELEESWYEDFAAEAAGNMAFADEVVFVKASSDEYVKNIQEALEKRVKSRKDTLQSYAPDEYDKLCKSEVKVKGKYVYLIVGKDISKAESAAEKAF